MNLAEMVFTNILAMDAYNRGYGVTFPIDLGGINSFLGNAKFVNEPFLGVGSTAVAEGFYAAAYSFANGPTVISYRGTDTRLELALTDYPIMKGDWQDESVQLAMNFYGAVDAATDNPILLTGHSLGGGLAGFVASLMNRPAMLVDHIGFMTARAKQARRRSRAARRPRPATTAALDARASLA